jgi:hypothetical protein
MSTVNDVAPRDTRSKRPLTRGVYTRCSNNYWYSLWLNLRQRGSDAPSCAILQKHYAARGIGLHEPWRDDFDLFVTELRAEIGDRPDKGHSLDRKDNDKGYVPENLRWADSFTQMINRSNTCMLTYGGRTQPLSLWARELGVRERALRSRMERGWPAEKIIRTPVQKRRITPRKPEPASAVKFLNCLDCHDIVKLPPTGAGRTCLCRKSWGRYETGTHAVIKGPCRMLGLAGQEYRESVKGELMRMTLFESVERVTHLEPTDAIMPPRAA